MTALDEAKNVHNSYNTFNSGYKAVTAVMGSSVAGNILRLLTLLFLGIGALFLKQFINGLKREVAEKLTLKEKADFESYIRGLDRASGDTDFNHENDL